MGLRCAGACPCAYSDADTRAGAAPNAGPSALGTILSYRVLWKADPPDRRPLAILLVTNQTTQDLELAATKLGVPLLMV